MLCFCRNLYEPFYKNIENKSKEKYRRFYFVDVSFWLDNRVTRLGDSLHFDQLFKACGNNYFAQISHILGNFCKGVKIFNFSSGIIFGNFYRHLATFYWSYCLTTPPSKGRKRFGDDITDKKFDGYRAKELELGQSDQIWQFLKFSVANLLAKLAQIIGDNLVNFKNTSK